MNELELLSQLEAKQAEYKSKWDAYPSKTLADGSTAKDIPANDLEGLRELKSDIDDIGKKYQECRSYNDLRTQINEFEDQKNSPVNRMEGKAGGVQRKSITDQFMDIKSANRRFDDVDIDAEFNELKQFLGLEAKATMTTSANGFPPEILRDGSLVRAIHRPVQLLDFLPVVETSQNGIKYMRQSVRTSAAAETAENSALSEATLTYVEATDNIRKIGHYIPLTEEQIEDEPGIMNEVQNELGNMVRERLDLQVTVGDGSGQNLTGIYNASSIQTEAKSTNTIPDAILNAITHVRVDGRAMPNVIVLHSNDLVRLTQTKTADGQYIADVLMNGPMARVWGLPIVASEALTEGTGLVIDSRYFTVMMRKGLTLAMTDSHGEEFLKNVTVVRAHVRAGLKKLRGQAACRLTGLNA